MLCFNCDQALGNVRESLQVLDQLGEYLLRADPQAPYIPCVEYRFRGVTIEFGPDHTHAVGAS
jgi:hypothetical protein